MPLFFFLVAGFLPFRTAEAQNTAGALAYMKSMTDEIHTIIADSWAYTNAVAHGKSAKKVEAKRQTLVATAQKAKARISKLPPFEGDASLRDSILSYLDLNYHIINEDYAKILDMEAIAEESYDLMEAYLLAQDKANEKLEQAGEMMNEVQKKFAAAYNITLLEGGKDELSTKLESAGEVFKYYRKVYLIFFKSYKQELYFMEAMNKGDVNGMEQNKNTLIKYAEEGKASLDTIKSFKGDISLKTSCKAMLDFYKVEATEKAPDLINFFLVKDNYEKTQKAFEAKPQSKRTQADVDQYNKSVNEFNAAVNKYNAVNAELNQKRTKALNTWNESVPVFLDKHVPKDK